MFCFSFKFLNQRSAHYRLIFSLFWNKEHRLHKNINNISCLPKIPYPTLWLKELKLKKSIHWYIIVKLDVIKNFDNKFFNLFAYIINSSKLSNFFFRKNRLMVNFENENTNNRSINSTWNFWISFYNHCVQFSGIILVATR